MQQAVAPALVRLVRVRLHHFTNSTNQSLRIIHNCPHPGPCCLWHWVRRNREYLLDAKCLEPRLVHLYRAPLQPEGRGMPVAALPSKIQGARTAQ